MLKAKYQGRKDDGDSFVPVFAAVRLVYSPN